MDYLHRRDIFRLVDFFKIGNNKKIWDLMRKGHSLILGKEYLFIRQDKIRQSISSFDDDIDYQVVNIFDIMTGDGRTYKYTFLVKCGDYVDKFSKGTKYAMLWYEFTTGEKVTLESIANMFNKQFSSL